MIDNQHKLKTYAELIPKLTHVKSYKVQVYSTTLDRKKKFEKWLKELKMNGEVRVFGEIR